MFIITWATSIAQRGEAPSRILLEESGRVIGPAPQGLPHDPRIQACACERYVRSGRGPQFPGKCVEAEKVLREAIRIQEPLVADLPERMEFREDLANSLLRLGEALHDQRRFAEEEELLRRSIGISKELVNATPELIIRRALIADALMALAALERDRSISTPPRNSLPTAALTHSDRSGDQSAGPRLEQVKGGDRVLGEGQHLDGAGANDSPKPTVKKEESPARPSRP